MIIFYVDSDNGLFTEYQQLYLQFNYEMTFLSNMKYIE